MLDLRTVEVKLGTSYADQGMVYNRVSIDSVFLVYVVTYKNTTTARIAVDARQPEYLAKDDYEITVKMLKAMCD